jgi:pyrimidine-nucleoside phosphorylase
MNPVPLLDRKRQGGELSADEIESLVQAFVAERVTDYQMAAFAMAVCCRGMSPDETNALTKAMLESGDRLSWEPGPPVVDKHSTGGQGDKSSLILAPLLATLGFRVPMVSGRGLGPTGGTLDKLAAIPGFRTNLSLDQIKRQVARIGCAMAGQTERLCPADRKLYALRDATGTVASVPLITSSILSKKLAESLDALVLDVKFGAGAFMPSVENARVLARSLVDTARQFGLQATALLTSMEQPTGRMVGNAAEVMEAMHVLKGVGPDDLQGLVTALAVELLLATKRAATAEEAAVLVSRAIDSGAALEKFREMVVAQGGDPDASFHSGKAMAVRAVRRGFVSGIDGSKVGYALIALGGGRMKTTDAVDPMVGIHFAVRLGDHVSAGDPLAWIIPNGRGEDEAVALLNEAILVADEPPNVAPLVLERVA